MPNLYIENRDRWERLSEVDFLGAFANGWLAFNAWYRNAYDESQDRKIINLFKDDSNIVRSRIVPLLTSPSEEGEQLRSNIGLLHHRLENFHLHNGKGPTTQRITLTNIYIRDRVSTSQNASMNGMAYSVVPGGQGNPPKQVLSTVVNRRGIEAFRYTQPQYNEADLLNNTDFNNQLNQNQRGQLLALYRNINPRCIENLLVGNATSIQAGAYQFLCTPQDLFAGLVEVLYMMRCIFFHGELVPSREASACYEPAYHLVRKFLLSAA